MTANDRIRKIMGEHLGEPEHKILPDTYLYNDLRIDSLDCIELVMAIEEEFSIAIPDDDFEDRFIVSDIVKYVESKIQ